MKLLLGCNANIEARFEDKGTPLYSDAWCNSTEVAKLLLKHVADIKGRDMDNATPENYNP